MERKGDLSSLLIWLIPMLLSFCGLVVIAAMTGWSGHSPAFKQLLWLSVSFICFLAVMSIPLTVWTRVAWGAFAASFLFLGLTLAPGIGVTIKGASRWIHFGSFSFQPAEALSFALLLLLVRLYQRNARQLKALAVTGGIVFLCAVFLLRQPDFGSVLLIVALSGALLVDRYGFLLPAGALAVLTPLMYLVVMHQGYRQERIAVWLDPWSDPMGSGYQVIQGLIAFANGGLSGIGVNRSQDFLPEVHNDFIFPAMGEQFGLIGTMVLLGCFIIWSFVALQVYRRSVGISKQFAWGCCVSVILPLFINIGGVTKLIPLSGMPLPFVSYGGTSLLFMWMRVGILARVARESAQGGDES
ncbi:FtsW/RodA/SpoVE family cell cycle protein [Jonquetella anthropi]|uniref:FtsW/RodA/SpoVE family cell cycle protein n=1 Tax=Jonquetella anthropi TaxID=428712 RepID=UPI0001B90FA4|nr:FtsW/RodA/SpoVE family cell cycle protein [Jonquetella anthropi]EEX48056.1 cell cycle protein, FtsW/RodA/SpoVE family [Jonquetella anthropi E3_33 E1]